MAILEIRRHPVSAFQREAVSAIASLLQPYPDAVVDAGRSGVDLARGQQPGWGDVPTLRCSAVPRVSGAAEFHADLWEASAAFDAGSRFYYELDDDMPPDAALALLVECVRAVLAGDLEETVTYRGPLVVRTEAVLLVPSVSRIRVSRVEIPEVLLGIFLPKREQRTRYVAWPAKAEPERPG
jgi:hypothetical protein